MQPKRRFAAGLLSLALATWGAPIVVAPRVSYAQTTDPVSDAKAADANLASAQSGSSLVGKINQVGNGDPTATMTEAKRGILVQLVDACIRAWKAVMSFFSGLFGSKDPSQV